MMMKKMCYLGIRQCADFAPLILRVVVGITFLAHGGQKLFGWFGGGGIVGTTGFLQQLGFAGAGFLAWVLGLVEFLGGIALVLGILTPVASALLAVIMVVALFSVHFRNGFFAQSGGFEYVLVLFAAVVSLVLSGPGKWSLDAKYCKRQGSGGSGSGSA